MKNDLFIKRIILEREKIEDFSKYPFNIPIVENFLELELHSNVTFFVGENGVGKSTFIEAIAILLKLNPEGGTNNFVFNTRDTHSSLYEYLRLHKTGRVSELKYFLRAESFYNVASEIINNSETSGCGPLYGSYGGNLHECSHGESFIKLVQNRFTENGLYILDEPEAALSPSRQMALLCMIDSLAKKGSQFIIATHSPILISYQKGEILDLNQNFKKVEYKETDIYKTYKYFLDNPEKMQEYLFEDEE